VVIEQAKAVGRKRWLWLLICVVALASIAGVLAVRMHRRAKSASAQKELHARLDAIRQAGQPVSEKDLAMRYPDPPPEHDAVLLLKPALAALIKPKDSSGLPLFDIDWPPYDVPFSQSTLSVMRAYVDQNRKSIDLVPREVLKSAWVGSGFAKGVNNLIEVPVSDMGTLAKVLCLDAVLHAESGNSHESVQSLEKALLIAHTFKNDTILHGLVKRTWSKLACDSLIRILGRVDMVDADLKSISDLLPEIDRGFSKELFINERCFGVSEAENLKLLADMAKARHASSLISRWVGDYQASLIYTDQDLLDFLNIVEPNIASMDLPLSNAIPKLLELEKSWKAHETELKAESASKLRFFKRRPMSAMSIVTPPPGIRYFITEIKTVAFERATLTAIAIQRYRLAHAGLMPESLLSLVPQFLETVPKDPFDNQDLRFKKIQHGFFVYSIGPDFIDDSGKPEPYDAKESDHYDIVFTVAR
jgi:hypothetical protein